MVKPCVEPPCYLALVSNFNALQLNIWIPSSYWDQGLQIVNLERLAKFDLVFMAGIFFNV